LVEKSCGLFQRTYNGAMCDETPPGVTRLLRNWRDGDSRALDTLFPLVYKELRSLAAAHLSRERSGHTLHATALVNEAYLRMVGAENVEWDCRARFFGFAARLIRNILVDHARSRGRAKRGSGLPLVCLNDVLESPEEKGFELIALDDAMSALANRSPRQSEIVELRFFGGLSIEETAAVMDLSPTTVKSEWRLARAWLYRELSRDGKLA
jgi:RNA polymerase sigma factor (TIGR02999 family)